MGRRSLRLYRVVMGTAPARAPARRKAGAVMTRRAGPEVRLCGAGAVGRSSAVFGAGKRPRGSRAPADLRKLVGRSARATGWVSPGPPPH